MDSRQASLVARLRKIFEPGYEQHSQPAAPALRELDDDEAASEHVPVSVGAQTKSPPQRVVAPRRVGSTASE